MLKDTIRRSSDVEGKLEEQYLGSIAHEEKYKTFRMRLRGGQVSMLIDQPACSFRYIESVQKVCRNIQNRMEKHGYNQVNIIAILQEIQAAAFFPVGGGRTGEGTAPGAAAAAWCAAGAGAAGEAAFS